MATNNLKQAAPIVIALGLLAAGVAWKVVGSARPRGYDGEPKQGINGLPWGAAAPDDVELASSEGRSGAVPAGAVIHGLDRVAPEHAGGFESFFRDPPSEPLWELPAQRPQYAYYQGRLGLALVSLERPCDAELVARLGEAHETVEDGPFTSQLWYGEQVDIEYRTGGQLGGDTALLILMHRPTLDPLAP